MMNKLYERPPMLLFLSYDLFCERREMLGEMRWLTEDIFLQISDATAQPFPLSGTIIFGFGEASPQSRCMRH